MGRTRIGAPQRRSRCRGLWDLRGPGPRTGGRGASLPTRTSGIRTWLVRLGGVASLAIAGAASLLAQSGVPEGYELVYSQDFSDASALDDFTFSDRRAWKHGSEGGRGYLDLEGGSRYRPKHRSPLNIALIDHLLLEDFVLEAEAWQTGREYGHRDLSFFFGFEGPNRYCYAHLATEPDDRAHNVFLVDNADRAPMGAVPDAGVDWGRGWKRVRVERQDGALRVYFDGEKTPTVSTDRDPLGWGRVGFGSFDDSGRFSQVRIWAQETREAAAPAFR